MSLLRRLDIMDPFFCPPPSFVAETSVFAPRAFTFPSFLDGPEDICLALDLLSPNPTNFDLLDSVEDLVQIERTPCFSSYRRVLQRVRPESYDLQSLCYRVSALESRFDRLVSPRGAASDRKYTWTAEIEGKEADRKYKWTAEIKAGKKEKEKEKHHHLHHHLLHHHGGAKSYKWTAEIKEKGEEGYTRTYTWRSSTGGGDESEAKSHKDKKEKKKEKKKGDKFATRAVEIEEPSGHEAVVLRQAFAKRAGTNRKAKGKKKDLSPLDAALMIQMSFRAYLIRRSQALRALRELAVAKSKLKEIRAFFNNFSYRRRVAHDAEERQRFAEKIIVLLLTVDAIEGADVMVRAAKKSMIDELEAMLEVVDPHPPDKSLSMRRRTFDVPDGVIQKEIADGVAQIVKMLDQEENSTTASET
ncbi:BAG family molecular chaperone regulator 7 [Rhodamnia argentea]|uniref:BAG family molecular chaperone regulator 7 n=1 Tax=Rhodamnia argentea TaxID=178133 RepID=A0ABM3GT13_9MYRT|nr:BAG family molecular chaperone regulator 7 [Rhodamnia argentea]